MGLGEQAWEPPAQSSHDPTAPGHLWSTTQVNQIGAWVSLMPKPDAPTWPPPGLLGHGSVNVSLLTSDRVPGPVVTSSTSISSGLALLGREGLGQDPHFHTCRECQLPSVVQARGCGLDMTGAKQALLSPAGDPRGAGFASPRATRGNSHTWLLTPLHGAQAESTLDQPR